MPYVNAERRPSLDKAVELALEKLGELEGPYNEGDLNYLLSKIIWSLFDKKKSYSNASKLIATLECIKLEFYRRKVALYEMSKVKENGDVKSED